MNRALARGSALPAPLELAALRVVFGRDTRGIHAAASALFPDGTQLDAIAYLPSGVTSMYAAGSPVLQDWYRKTAHRAVGMLVETAMQLPREDRFKPSAANSELPGYPEKGVSSTQTGRDGTRPTERIIDA